MIFSRAEALNAWALTVSLRLISPRPLLMIIGSDARTAYISREAIERAAEPKELFVIDGATHVSLYDVDEHVTQAVAKLSAFFTAGLVAPAR